MPPEHAELKTDKGHLCAIIPVYRRNTQNRANIKSEI